MIALQDLNLSCNELKEVPAGTFPPSLTCLDLSNNSFERIPQVPEICDRWYSTHIFLD